MTTEPTTSAAMSIAAGITAVFVALLGIEPQSLIWGIVGAILGLPFAAPSSRWRAICVFIAVSLSCALLGTWASARYFDGSMYARNGCTLMLGVIFHPLFAAIVATVPAVIQAFVRSRLGGPQ